jgi:hypothetical protein
MIKKELESDLINIKKGSDERKIVVKMYGGV